MSLLRRKAGSSLARAACTFPVRYTRELSSPLLNAVSLPFAVGFFLCADVPQLKVLELRNTNFRLPAGFFDNLTALETLELGSNQLKSIPVGTFDGLKNIELLNLWKNDFKKLEAEVFRGLTSLISLDLNQNQLRTLPADIFKVRIFVFFFFFNSIPFVDSRDLKEMVLLIKIRSNIFVDMRTINV